MIINYVEHTVTKNGVVVSYEKPNFKSKNDAIEYYNTLWWTYKGGIINETHLAFTANDGDAVVNVRVGSTEL